MRDRAAELHSSLRGTTDPSPAEREGENPAVALLQGRLPEPVTVEIAALIPGDSPRSEGQSGEHVRRLADLEGPLPPILVNRQTMEIIDGTHRLLAAILKGEHTIEAILFDGPAEETFLWAVHANTTHGLPLSQADRREAVRKIIASHPHLSDRAVARIAGLGTKAVATVRRTFRDSIPQPPSRVGSDGRTRPVNGG